MIKKKTIKELGKLFLDFTKIIFAIAFLTPIIKDGNFDMIPVVAALVTGLMGIYLINKGAKDE